MPIITAKLTRRGSWVTDLDGRSLTDVWEIDLENLGEIGLTIPVEAVYDVATKAIIELPKPFSAKGGMPLRSIHVTKQSGYLSDATILYSSKPIRGFGGTGISLEDSSSRGRSEDFDLPVFYKANATSADNPQWRERPTAYPRSVQYAGFTNTFANSDAIHSGLRKQFLPNLGKLTMLDGIPHRFADYRMVVTPSNQLRTTIIFQTRGKVPKYEVDSIGNDNVIEALDYLDEYKVTWTVDPQSGSLDPVVDVVEASSFFEPMETFTFRFPGFNVNRNFGF